MQITNTCLSSILSIPVSEADILLKQYFTDMKNHVKTINASYILIGVLTGGNKLSIVLSKDQELPEKRKLFKSISCEEIYSIQKHKDFNVNALTYVEPLNKIVEDYKPWVINCVN